MSFPSLAGNAIAAKAKAIYGKRLTEENYQELLRLDRVADVATYLKNHPGYADYFSGVDERQIHRGQLEAVLQRTYLEKSLKLMHYDFSGKESFFDYVVANLEIHSIRQTLIYLNLDQPEKVLIHLPAYLREYVSFDLMALPSIHSFDDLLDILWQTPYYAVLLPYAAKNGEISLNDCDHALDSYYYRRLLEFADIHYRGKTREELREIILTEIDILNCNLIYRLKNFFHRSPKEIRAMLIPFFGELTPKVLGKMLESKTDEEFLAAFRYGKADADGRKFNFIEDYTKRVEYQIIKKKMQFSSSAPVVFFALMALTRIEIENLTILIEGIRYQNAPSEIRKILVY